MFFGSLIKFIRAASATTSGRRTNVTLQVDDQCGAISHASRIHPSILPHIVTLAVSFFQLPGHAVVPSLPRINWASTQDSPPSWFTLSVLSAFHCLCSSSSMSSSCRGNDDHSLMKACWSLGCPGSHLTSCVNCMARPAARVCWHCCADEQLSRPGEGQKTTKQQIQGSRTGSKWCV